jgi:hypothetical protein
MFAFRLEHINLFSVSKTTHLKFIKYIFKIKLFFAQII